MRSSRTLGLGLGIGLAISLAPTAAQATGFTDVGNDIAAQTETTVVVHGAFRVRGELLYNLDLDRGLTPSGQPLFPVPLADPKAQTLTTMDFRLRTDVAFYAPGYGVAVKARFDAPDNLVFGSAPDGVPSASSSQRPVAALRLKRAYGEALTPIGVFSAGRMGSQWGLGMLANAGDCADCNSGDSADRVAFLTPALGHIFAASFDVSSSGPFRARKIETRAIDVDPSDDVRTVTLAFLRYRDDAGRERRRKAGKITVEYGAYFSHRWQKNDVPSDYLPIAAPPTLNSAQIMYRGYTASALDGWFRVTTPNFRLEIEAAGIFANIEQGSLIPGVLLRQPVGSKQFGFAVESEIGAPEADFGAGLDLGLASGDPAPGFGVKASVTGAIPKPGDLDGSQANPPYDNHVDNFRFHPDYHVDRILFREIIGTVTDAVYLRPHARYTLARLGPSKLTAQLAAVVSFAMEAASTPGQKAPLGVELDPTLAYGNRDGFNLALEHAVLFPLSGLDNPEMKLSAKPAQSIRMRATYAF
jgi:uncharacterized protein (TIGR04551 family)